MIDYDGMVAIVTRLRDGAARYDHVTDKPMINDKELVSMVNEAGFDYAGTIKYIREVAVPQYMDIAALHGPWTALESMFLLGMQLTVEAAKENS